MPTTPVEIGTVCRVPAVGSHTTLAPPSRPLRTRIAAGLQLCGDGRIYGAQALVDGLIVALALFLAFVTRYDNAFTRTHVLQFFFWLPILIAGRLLLLRVQGVHRFLWRFVCLSDAIAIARSLLWVTAALLCLRWFYPPGARFAYWLRLPLGIVVPEFLLSLCGVLTIRSVCRIAQDRSDRAAGGQGRRGKRVLLYGAGRAGVMLARELAAQGGLEMVGFVDDDARKSHSVIAGLRVLGGGGSLAQIVRRGRVDEVMISIAAPQPGALSRIVRACQAIPIKTAIVPSAREILAGRVKISRVREVRIEDLLGRASAANEECAGEVRTSYYRKRVLVTGAGGSIGSELCRQLLPLEPAQLLVLDKDENSIYELEQELRRSHPQARIEPLIADLKIAERVESLFDRFRPQVVVHAAAHKHVPLMERHPCEAVLNNVLGMRNLLDACRAADIERLVFISSDKAVNPTNVMGATKRIGEKLLAAHASGAMRSAAVRFGNVMGSRGSVIPLFQRQIEQGGPVTITHPDMVRFFMTIPEAVQLVLCAGSLAARTETFVLDMGTPRRVLDMAREMIELAGLRPGEDIEIAITGLRPGEKLEEELACAGESLHQTRFEKIFQIPNTGVEEVSFRRHLDALIAAARAGQEDKLLAILLDMGLGYQPAGSSAAPVTPLATPLDLVAYAS